MPREGLTYDPWSRTCSYIGGWVDYTIYKIKQGKSLALSLAKILPSVMTMSRLRLPVFARVGWHLVLTLNTHPDLVLVMDSITGEDASPGWGVSIPSARSESAVLRSRTKTATYGWYTRVKQGRAGMAYLLDMGLALDDSPEVDEYSGR